MGLTFDPDWRVPPGGTIREVLEARGITVETLGAALCADPEPILSGEADITWEIAVTLERVLGVTAQFWFNLSREYRRPLTRRPI